MRSWVAVGLAGALGVLARHVVQVSAPRYAGLPWGTLAINITGALAIGFVAGLVAHRLHAPMWAQEALTIGFLGGYTTFSALSLETVQLAGSGRYVAATAYSLGSLAAGLVAVIVGSRLSAVT